MITQKKNSYQIRFPDNHVISVKTERSANFIAYHLTAEQINLLKEIDDLFSNYRRDFVVFSDNIGIVLSRIIGTEAVVMFNIFKWNELPLSIDRFGYIIKQFRYRIKLQKITSCLEIEYYSKLRGYSLSFFIKDDEKFFISLVNGIDKAIVGNLCDYYGLTTNQLRKIVIKELEGLLK